jgi:hypothetical protein
MPASLHGDEPQSKAELCLAKTRSGLNAIEISNIQGQVTEPH